MTDTTAVMPSTKGMSERRLVQVVAAVQFVNVLDFVMVMPLGPDFATSLDIPMSQIGIIGGSYTLAAAVSGVVGSAFLDRFDRRKALGLTMLGLVLATAAGGFATGMKTLVLARVLAGIFGGPATSIAIAAVSDAVPAERRGRAMGTVMAAFSVASVLGVPAGLELARLYGWRAPFFAVALLGAVVTALAMVALPPLRAHLFESESESTSKLGDGVKPELATWLDGPPFSPLPPKPAKPPLLDRLSLLSLLNNFVVMLGVFLIIPNLAAFFQYNLEYPREKLGLLYLVGGFVSFVTMRAIGSLVDRFGATRFVVLGTALHLLALWFGFVKPEYGLPPLLIFVVFMLSGSIRMVPTSSLATRVPYPVRRAGFMSAQSAVRHTGSALGAMFGALILSSAANGELQNMEWVAGFACLLAAIAPLLTFHTEQGVRQRELAPLVASPAGRDG